jgi:S-adenosylmethionine decarboxylase proenzyme
MQILTRPKLIVTDIKETHESIGTHLLVTLKGCSSDILNNENELAQLTRTAASATGATVLKVCSHQFAPQGVTAIAVLAESHASLHTYPESNKVFWDCFTCGSTCNPELSVRVLVDALKPKSITTQFVPRS